MRLPVTAMATVSLVRPAATFRRNPAPVILAMTAKGRYRHMARRVTPTYFETLCGHEADPVRTVQKAARHKGRLRAADCPACATAVRFEY